MYYIDLELIGRAEKNFRIGIFLDKNLLGWGYRKHTTFFLGLIH